MYAVFLVVSWTLPGSVVLLQEQAGVLNCRRLFWDTTAQRKVSRGSRIGVGDGIRSQVGEEEADLLSPASEGQERISSLPRQGCGALLRLWSPPKAQSKKIAADVTIRGKLIKRFEYESGAANLHFPLF